MAWVLVEANGARLFGSTEPGGQRVEALGGSAVEACGARVGGVGGVVGVGAAKATTEAAPNNNPDKLTYICFMTIHRLLYKSSMGLPIESSPAPAALPCAAAQFDLGRRCDAVIRMT
jgi:hypothetical protein